MQEEDNKWVQGRVEVEMEDFCKRAWEAVGESGRANKISTKLIAEVEGLKRSVKAAEDQTKVREDNVVSLEVELSISRCCANQLQE